MRSTTSARIVSAAAAASLRSTKKASPPGPLVEGRHLAGVEVVGHAHDAAVLGLPEDRREARDRHHAAVDEGREHLAGPDRGELVGVADEDQPGLVGQRRDRGGHEREVDHRGLVDDEDVEVERLGERPREAGSGRLDAEQAVQGRGLGAGGLREAARGASGGCGERDAAALADEHVEQQPHDRGLADARPAGDDREPRAEGQLEGAPLIGREREPAALLGVHDRGRRRERDERRGRVEQRAHARGQRALGREQLGPVDEAVVEHAPLLDAGRQHLAHRQLVDLEEGRGLLDEQLRRQPDVALLGRASEQVGQARGDALRRVGLVPEPACEQVGRAEADAPDLLGEPPGVVAHDLDRALAVGAPDALRESRPQPVLLEEDERRRRRALLLQLGEDEPGLAAPQPGHGVEQARVALEALEHVGAERVDDALGGLGADALDAPAAEEADQAAPTRGRPQLAALDLDLPPVGRMARPAAAQAQGVALDDARHRADDGDGLAAVLGLEPRDRVAVVLVAEGDREQRAGQRHADGLVAGGVEQLAHCSRAPRARAAAARAARAAARPRRPRPRRGS
jgi:hypothetical protein